MRQTRLGAEPKMFRAMLCMLMLSGCGRKLWQAPDPNLHAAAITDLVEAARLEAGATAAVARVNTPKGTLVVTLGTEKTDGPAVSAAHRFGLRDLTGALTATAILILAQENTIVLNDPISKFVPNTPENVTLAQLLTMRSGIPDFLQGFPPDQVTSAFDLLATIDLTPTFEPGSRFEYSRTNFVLLGEVIAAVSGKPWHEFMATRMFEPLRLFRTEFPAGLTPSQPFAASEPMSFSHFQAAGGLASTAEEVETLGKALAEGAFLSDFMHQERLKLGSCEADVRCDRYGYGIMENGGLLGFAGAWSGYAASVFHETKSEMTITVLSNGPARLRETTAAIAQAIGFKEE